jgi:hypothetical protein
MKTSDKTQNIFFDLNFDESIIRNAYEDLFENSCHLYFELKKAFFEANELMSSNLIDSIIFQS